MLSFIKSTGKAPLTLAALGFFIVLFASTYHLSESPGIWFDEGMFTQTALNLERYGVQAIQTAPGELVSAESVTGGFTFIAPVALSYKLFGVGVLQGRAVMVLFIVACAVASYALLWTLFDAWIGAWGLLLLSSFAMLYGNGKSVLGEVPGLFFMVLGALALAWLERSFYRNLWAYAATGLAIGLFVATKPNFILILPALALAWLIRWREVRFRVDGFVLGALVFLLPVGVWLFSQVNGTLSFATILSFYANPYSATDMTALAIQNALRFVTEAAPLYLLLLLMAWSAAFFVRRTSAKKGSIVELTLFLFTLIVVAEFVRLPGWYRYLFPAMTVALLFLPHAVTSVFQSLSIRFPFLMRVSWLPYAFLTLMIVGQCYQLARSSYVAGYYSSHRARDVAEMLASLPPDAGVFVYNVPEVVVLLGDRPYYQFLKPYSPESFGDDKLPRLAAGDDEYVILGTGSYNPKDPQFARYHQIGTANRYTLLKKI
jgi:4-amino-4-deoxy-L-arabinose transferase-like glycosyltransferase